jgi:hypothetical protein
MAEVAGLLRERAAALLEHHGGCCWCARGAGTSVPPPTAQWCTVGAGRRQGDRRGCLFRTCITVVWKLGENPACLG